VYEKRYKHCTEKNDNKLNGSMKKVYSVLLMIYICQLSIAQNILTGKVIDRKTGEVITGATVYIPELKTGDIADNNGVYKIDKLPKTSVTVQVSFLGYKSIVEKVDLSATTTRNFELDQAITEINEIVITGTSRTTEITKSSVPIISLSSKELQQNLSTNIIDAISKLPGISAVTTGPNVSKPFIHGLGFNRVITLFDGVRQEGQQWGDEHGIDIDENAVDHIEIIKGPASLTYGSDALAGVVNLLPASAFHLDTIQGHVETDYQTNNGLINTSASLNGNRKGIIWGGVITHKQAKNYKDKYDRRVYGTAFNESDLRVFAGLNKQWGYSHLNFSIFNDQQEIPDGSRDSVTRKFTKQITEADTYRPIVSDSELNSYKISVLHQHVQHYLLYSSNNFIIGTSKLGVTVAYQQSVRQEFSHPEFPHIPGTYLDLKTLTFDIKYTLPELKVLETTVGINGMYQRNSNKGTVFIIPDYHQLDIGPFVLITKTLKKLDLSAGIRYDIRIFNNDQMYTSTNPETGLGMKVNPPDTSMATYTFYSYEHVFSGISGSIGATYNITSKFLIKANIARGYRAPNILEISANGVHSGDLIYQIGNKRFKPEFSLQEDIGISYRSDHISGNLDIFNNNISNYIFNQKLLSHSGMDSVIIKGNQTFKFQQSAAQLYGMEALLDIHPYDWLHFENSISVIYGLNKGGNGMVITNGSKYLPFIPPLHSSTEIRVNLKRRLKHLGSMYFKAGIEYYARQNRIYSAFNTETPTPGYILFNAGVGSDIMNKHGKVIADIDILVNNITNAAYQSHLSRLKYFEQYPNNSSGRSGIYDMGRNISFKLTIPLNF
jgi:iron complex outermembrane recepter protein